jgi:hypothetical protein
VDHANSFVNWAVAGILFILAVVVIITNGAENLSRINKRIQE